jgi:hypothetical protein
LGYSPNIPHLGNILRFQQQILPRLLFFKHDLEPFNPFFHRLLPASDRVAGYSPFALEQTILDCA